MSDTDTAIAELSAKVDVLIAICKEVSDQGKTVADINQITNKVTMALQDISIIRNGTQPS